MNLNYSQTKPEMLIILWETMEELQNKHPYYQWGWAGFVPIAIWA